MEKIWAYTMAGVQRAEEGHTRAKRAGASVVKQHFEEEKLWTRSLEFEIPLIH
jgi:hypothetical protein